MRIEQVGAITSSVRKFMEDRRQIADGLRRIREIGYQAVQISGIGDYDVKWMRETCAELGLTLCATHEGSGRIVDEPEAIVAKLQKLGCDVTAYPYPHVDLTSVEGARKIAAALGKSGAVLREAGIALAYHNHDIEFQRFDGRLALEIIYEETDPADLQGEPDTHWIQHGGGDPAAWCRRLRGRLPVLHAKDYVINAEREVQMTSVGSGNLDWQGICAAADEAGCRWFVVEHDGGTFESLESSFRYISDNLCA